MYFALYHLSRICTVYWFGKKTHFPSCRLVSFRLQPELAFVSTQIDKMSPCKEVLRASDSKRPVNLHHQTVQIVDGPMVLTLIHTEYRHIVRNEKYLVISVREQM